MNFKNAAEELSFSLSFGLAFWGYFVFLIAVLKILYLYLIASFLAIITLILFKEIAEFFMLLHTEIKKIRLGTLSLSHKFLLILVFAYLIVIFFLCFAPACGYDDLAYHLSLPKLYIQEHSYVPTPWHWQSNQPFTIEMLFTMAKLFNGDSLAHLFSYLMLLGTVLALWGFCKRYFDEKSGLISILVFLSIHFVYFYSSGAYNDEALTFYVFLSLYSFINYATGSDEKNRLNWLRLSAAFCGLSLGIKYSGSYIFILIFFGIFFIEVRKSLKTTFMYLFGFVFFTFLVASPWYIKNYLTALNPFYPFLYNAFGGLYLTRESAAVLFKSHQVEGIYGFGKGIRELVLLPWNLTFYGKNFSQILSPVFLVVLPLVVFLKKIKKEILILILFSIGYTLIWFYTYQNTRFLLPALVWISIVSGYIVVEFSRVKFMLSKIIYAFLIFTFLFQLGRIAVAEKDKLYVAFGLKDKISFLQERRFFARDLFDISEYINENIEKDSIIYCFNTAEPYYCSRKYIYWISPQDRLNHADFEKYREVLDYLKKHKANYMLIGENDKTKIYIENFLSEKAEFTAKEGNYFLYRVKYD